MTFEEWFQKNVADDDWKMASLEDEFKECWYFAQTEAIVNSYLNAFNEILEKKGAN